MKRFISIFLLGMLPLNALSGFDDGQEEALYECVYKYTISGDVQETYTAVLLIGRNMTRFYDYTSYAVDSLLADGNPPEEEIGRLDGIRLTSMFHFDSEVFQNIPPGKMTVLQEAFPDKLSYEEDLASFEWEMENVTDTICGYICRKAVTNYGGRQWTAWYAPEIPYSSGPWKFNGLPGLILSVKDSDGIHDFESIAFHKGMMQISYHEDPKIHKSDRSNVLRAKLRSEKNIEAGVKPDRSQVWDYYIVMDLAGNKMEYYNGIAMRSRPNGYNPIELE